MPQLNNKESFFKYYSPNSAKLVLSNCTRKWSNPLEFNDPFDNQFNFQAPVDIEEVALKKHTQIMAAITGEGPIPHFQNPQNTLKLELMKVAYRQNPNAFDGEFRTKLFDSTKQKIIDDICSRNLQANQEIQSKLKDTTIFCLTETNDNLLMWAHYAKEHKGAAIKFLNRIEVDSPLSQAQKVNYTDQIPILNLENFSDQREFAKYVIASITLTKSIDWAYEKEWRIVSSSRSRQQNSEIIPFAPEEIGGVYLGCRMANEDKEEILQITTQKYPTAEVYQASKHESEFKLVFERIH